ncbi:hypothetical protein [Cupriavidus taiwanensis]|uniref:hypothetical protein n=1 Tax=Cupriavidus taiwanensis TaxID=164546 RepID=UPI0039C2140E
MAQFIWLSPTKWLLFLLLPLILIDRPPAAYDRHLIADIRFSELGVFEETGTHKISLTPTCAIKFESAD